ncbi:Uncharacterised protein [uncultured archaeon]|nr:Uncharacterised protein [uncultured archaeon]
MAEKQISGKRFSLGAAYVPKAIKVVLPLVAFIAFEGVTGSLQAQDKSKGGDSTFVFQIQKEKAQKATGRDSVLDSIPKLKVPDVKTLEHYYPFGMTDSDFVSRGGRFETFRLSWLGIEDRTSPFGLPEKVIAKYSKEEKIDLMARWEIAKTELIVAFQSRKEGITPKNALETHTPEEIDKLLEWWNDKKELDKDIPGQRPKMK